MIRILFRRLVISSCFLLIFGLTACGGGEETPVTTTPPNTTPPPPAPAIPQITMQDTSVLENAGELTFVAN